MNHWPISPSGLHRVMRWCYDSERWVPVCPGSLKLPKGQRFEEETDDSAKGTSGHEMLLELVKFGKPPESNDVV